MDWSWSSLESSLVSRLVVGGYVSLLGSSLGPEWTPCTVLLNNVEFVQGSCAGTDCLTSLLKQVAVINIMFVYIITHTYVHVNIYIYEYTYI